MSIESRTITNTDFHFKGQTAFYRGKVRDVYHVGDKLIMIASDRISAFDHILPRSIPYKGEILNRTANYFLEATKDIVPNWVIETPDPNVTIGWACEPVKVEMVIRGYLAGHAWRVYQAGGRLICGVSMPDGLRESDRLPEPIITPTTKASEGHDEDISREEIIARGIVPEAIYQQMEKYTRALYQKGSEMASVHGLILVDTKYEFGIKNGQLMVIDEIHTPDSSRYFYQEGYEQRQENGERQLQLSKEFVREWLMAHGFQGLEGQIMPHMPDPLVELISDRYIELYEKVTGKNFEKADTTGIYDRMRANLRDWLG
jgi:phosphoribosylaminoimidazole-succinocarboxamide synthase